MFGILISDSLMKEKQMAEEHLKQEQMHTKAFFDSITNFIEGDLK